MNPHPRLRAICAAVFATQFVVLDACTRGVAGYARHPTALLGAALSVTVWALVGSLVARGIAGRALIAAFVASGLVVDGVVYRYYGTWLDAQVVASAAHGWADVRPIFVRLLPAGLSLVALLAAVEYGLMARSAGLAPTRVGRMGLLAVVAFVALAALLSPSAGLTPELRALRTVAVLWRSPPPVAAGRVAVPPLPSSREEVPSVMLVVTESVGASSYCNDAGADCAWSPEVSALLPDRVPLRQMRALASYTALSVAMLLTGRSLVGPDRHRERVDEAPTLFDLAHATRISDRAPFVAYWSAQAASVLPRDPGDLRGVVDSFITLETLLGHGVDDEDDAVGEDMDGRLAHRCVEELPRVPRPAVIVLHLLGTHAPYFFTPDRAPFQPTSSVISWAGLPSVANSYRDAIVTQDHALAACLRAFIAHQDRAPWVILFTSDHGEAFGEHGAIHHGQNLYDEQIHVPAWVATSEGALGASERDELSRHTDAFVTHLDIVPTILDALGVLHGLAFSPLAAHLGGRSLLAPVTTSAALPMTNCTDLFPCPLDTWGVLGAGHALVAQPWDADWNCVDLMGAREHTTGPPCDALDEASRGYFATRPGGQPNRR